MRVALLIVVSTMGSISAMNNQGEAQPDRSQMGVLQSFAVRAGTVVQFGNAMQELKEPVTHIVVKAGEFADNIVAYYQQSLTTEFVMKQKMLEKEVTLANAALEEAKARTLEAQARMKEVENQKCMIEVLNNALKNQTSHTDQLLAVLINKNK